MRVLLDECLPRGLIRELPGHDVRTVTQVGWSGVTNGELLRRAAAEFDFLLTIDQRFALSSPIPDTITLVTLAAPSNRLDSLRPMSPKIQEALRVLRKGERVQIGAQEKGDVVAFVNLLAVGLPPNSRASLELRCGGVTGRALSRARYGKGSAPGSHEPGRS